MAGLLAAAPALALTANELFEDGNRLYRSDLYYAALLRYQQAGEQGMASPLLDYNMGVAHYRAHQYVRSREYLLRAVDSPSLRVAAQYNLGLNAYALGQPDEALRWLRLARDQQQNRKLSSYARVAIARILTEQGADEAIEVEEVWPREKPQVTRLELRADVGFGTNDNVFRAPNQNYRDRTQPGNPLVRPIEYSGAFVPFSISVKYNVSPYKDEGFYGAYRLAGHSYQDTNINDADAYAHEISFGSEFSFFNEEKGRTRELLSAFTVAQHEEVYTDPDTGNWFSTDEGTVQERMDYLRYGPQLAFRQSYERFAFGFNAKAQLWNYTDALYVPEYDHEFFRVGAFAQYKFTSTSLIALEAVKTSRRFGERPAFNLNGEQLDDNPAVRYDYLDLGVTARQRITDNIWFGVSYERRERIDKFEGYADYTRDSYGGNIYWQYGYRFRLNFGGYYRLYNYPRTFAFHDPTLNKKTLELATAELSASYRVTRRLYVLLEGNYTKKVSNDLRIGYEQTGYMLSLRWFQ